MEIAGILEVILLERGSVKILMDNSTIFRSETLKQLFTKLNA